MFVVIMHVFTLKAVKNALLLTVKDFSQNHKRAKR